MFRVTEATNSDIAPWLKLARQVEHLFGPMINHGFDRAVLANIERSSAFCVRSENQPQVLAGALLFDYRYAPYYRLTWMAVDTILRRKGIGQLLVNHALERITSPCSIEVITFGEDHPGGLPARRFYESFGFRPVLDQKPGPEGGSRQKYLLQIMPDRSFHRTS